MSPSSDDLRVLREGLTSASSVQFQVVRLTYQARYVRVEFPRRAMHASGDSPYRLSAKHHVLSTCLPLMAPFRSMLLTLRGGPQRLAPRARGVPVYPVVFPHSYSALSRRTRSDSYRPHCRTIRPHRRAMRRRGDRIRGRRGYGGVMLVPCLLHAA